MSLNSYFYFLLDSTHFFLYLLMMNLYIELDTIGWWNVSYGVSIIKAHRLHPLIFINKILIPHSFGYFLRWLSWKIENNCENKWDYGEQCMSELSDGILSMRNMLSQLLIENFLSFPGSQVNFCLQLWTSKIWWSVSRNLKW